MYFAIENPDGSFKERVLTTGNVEWDDTHLCPAGALTEAERAMFHVVAFTETVAPTPGRWQAIREVAPVKNSGVWEQQWEVYNLDLTLDAKKTEINNQVEDIARMKRDMLVANYSAGEMSAWSIKRTEATAFQASNDPATAPYLADEALERGITLASLADKVLIKAAQLSALESKIAGRCGALQDLAAAAQSEEELLAFDLNSGWIV